MSSDDVASAATQPEIKLPRKRVWDVPSKGPEPDAAVMLEGTASETAAREPAQAAVVTTSEANAPAQAPRRRHEVGSSEPRIERVVVRPGEESAEPEGQQAAPQRKGWWQRKFGGN
jgi:ribonuclease E